MSGTYGAPAWHNPEVFNPPCPNCQRRLEGPSDSGESRGMLYCSPCNAWFDPITIKADKEAEHA